MGYQLEQHKGDVRKISILTETRHKVNHFVSALQQYVQSQLSQVSWYRFLDSLKMVKDMLDLEAVHMTYLTESLHICFLSDGTQPIAGIIQNILQCAIDFRSCFTRCLLDDGSDDEKVTNRFSRPDISKVQTIRSVFTKNLEDLYLIYLQSPKHDGPLYHSSKYGEFDPCGSLDYNEQGYEYTNGPLYHVIKISPTTLGDH
ncbi:hypothetical protein OROGR_019703 [Orobanche gracilis]